MFEEKIKLNVEKIDNIIEKEICGQKFKFNKYLNEEECSFVINECMKHFIKTNNEKQNFSLSVMSSIQMMNICLCYLATNIDIDNISYEDLYIMGIFEEIKNTLINYQEIKDNVLTSISLMFNYIIYDAIEKLPSNKDMVDNLQEMRDILASNPEKAKEYANIIMANHPELKGLGEIFEKILNSLNKKE